MKLLLDTHLLPPGGHRSGSDSQSSPHGDRNAENEVLFSAASLWEIVIKRGLGRPDFQVDPSVLRRALLDNGYGELPITSEHVIYIGELPPKDKDPFDRVLVAQAASEGITLLTNGQKLPSYPGSIRKV